MNVAVLSGLTLLANGCRHAPVPEAKGQSSFAFIDQPVPPPPPSDGKVLEPVDRAQYREAQLKDNAALPVYPGRALKAKAGRALVGVHIMVDPNGRVSDIRPSMFVFSTPGLFASEFRDAVETAVRLWQFTPARVEYYEIRNENGLPFARVTRTEATESEFDLSFTFTATGGVQLTPTGG